MCVCVCVCRPQLPKLINDNFPADPDRMSISGHSMGGHGALICALKNPGKYKVMSPTVTAQPLDFWLSR